MTDALSTYVAARSAEFAQIPPERRPFLQELALYVRSGVAAGKPVRLTFVCTHNSRRSHLAQIWAQTAAAHYGVDGVETYSGGTEATAFNPRAVAALRRAGFDIPEPVPAANPRYQVRYRADRPALECFSKVYDQPPNPRSEYCAVMTCTQADQACPIVAGAAWRIALPYDDPKAFDGKPEESAQYDARCRQIAREMLYAFAQVTTAPS